jgi:hypothetical protein
MFVSVEVLVNSRSKEHNKTLIGLTNLRQEKTHRAIIYCKRIEIRRYEISWFNKKQLIR